MIISLGKHHPMKRVGILLIALALVAGMAGCPPGRLPIPPPDPGPSWTWRYGPGMT